MPGLTIEIRATTTTTGTGFLSCRKVNRNLLDLVTRPSVEAQTEKNLLSRTEEVQTEITNRTSINKVTLTTIKLIIAPSLKVILAASSTRVEIQGVTRATDSTTGTPLLINTKTTFTVGLRMSVTGIWVAIRDLSLISTKIPGTTAIELAMKKRLTSKISLKSLDMVRVI